MKVLVACEFSGRVRSAFEKRAMTLQAVTFSTPKYQESTIRATLGIL